MAPIITDNSLTRDKLVQPSNNSPTKVDTDRVNNVNVAVEDSEQKSDLGELSDNSVFRLSVNNLNEQISSCLHLNERNIDCIKSNKETVKCEPLTPNICCDSIDISSTSVENKHSILHNQGADSVKTVCNLDLKKQSDSKTNLGSSSEDKNLILNNDESSGKNDVSKDVASENNCLISHLNEISLKIKSENLTCLSLVNLALDTIDYDFKDFINITFIDLSDNRLSSLPNSFINFKNCTRLNISKNNFNEVPNVLYKDMYFIKDLDISFNCIKEFNMAPLCISYLISLNLSHNKLVSPPLWLLHDIPSSLKCLNLSFNPCFKEKLYSVFLDTFEANKISSRITELDISNTGFNRLHMKLIKQFSCLKVLRMNSKQTGANCLYNSIEELPNEIFNQLPLEDLEVENCNLTCLPESINKMSHLKNVYISNNNFTWLPEKFVHLECLSILRASRCHLVYLPKEMGLLTSLTELWLSFNDISSLPDMSECKDLRVLDLYNNSFSQLPVTLNHLKLEAFDFCGNYFSASTYTQVSDSASYENLKCRLREMLSSIEDRTSFIKIDYSSKCSSSSGSYSSSPGSWGSHKSTRSKTNTPFSSIGRCSMPGSWQDETWEVDPDEAWDPNFYGDMKTWSSDDCLSRCRMIASFTHRENYFCPYQERSNFFQNLYLESTDADENGQFDDV